MLIERAGATWCQSAASRCSASSCRTTSPPASRSARSRSSSATVRRLRRDDPQRHGAARRRGAHHRPAHLVGPGADRQGLPRVRRPPRRPPPADLGAAPGHRDLPRSVRRPRRRARAHRAPALAAHPPGRARAVPVALDARSVRHVELVPLERDPAHDGVHHRHRPRRTARRRRRAADSTRLLGELRSKLNDGDRRTGTADAAAQLTASPTRSPAPPRSPSRAVTSTLVEQVLANRQDKLVMAGAANLVRTEEDFSGSIYPVLEAIEEQVTLLRAVRRDGGRPATASPSASAARTHGFGLGETSVLAERLRSHRAASSRGSACSARPAWTTRTTWPRCAPSRATSPACSARRLTDPRPRRPASTHD